MSPIRAAIAILSGLAIAGCGTLSRAHAERAQAQLKCGLTVAEVERIVGGSLQPVEASPLVTHLYRNGFTDLWLRFENGGLRSSQIVGVVGFTGTHEEPRVEYCQQ